MSLERTILVAYGTEEQHDAADGNYAAGQFSFTEDGKRLRIGDSPTEGTALIVGSASGAAAHAPSVAGTTTLSLTSGHRRHHRKITPAVGADYYTHKIVLPAVESGAVAVLDQDAVIVLAEMPASLHPTIEFRNESASGTLLLSLPSSSTARKWRLEFVRWSGAWELWSIAELLIA